MSTQEVTVPSTNTEMSNSNKTLDMSHLTTKISNEVSPSHLLATSRVTSVSRTLTLHLYLNLATSDIDGNSSQLHSPSLLGSYGHSGINALKMELYTFPSKHRSVGHVYLYPNSTVTDR